jgi:hypothetical protein
MAVREDKKAVKGKSLTGALLLLFVLTFFGNVYAADIANDECMGCHGEKELSKKGPGGKSISLYFHKEPFEKSVHGAFQCVKCHDIKELPHGEKVSIAACGSCHGSSYKHYRSSVHGGRKAPKATCNDCHGHHTVEKAKTLTSTVCADCHGTAYRDYRAGIHSRGGKGTEAVATCNDCHGKTHDVLKKENPRSPVYDRNLPGTCSRCHANPEMVKKYKIPAEKAYTLYMDSIHGRALTKSGVLVSAACNDCHGSHAIKPHTDPTSTISAAHIPATCGKCHAQAEKAFQASVHGEEVKRGNIRAPGCATCHPAHEVRSVKGAAWMLDAIRECGTCHSRQLETYRHSYHGKITSLGFVRVAKCADCHGAHDVLPDSDPASRISKKNLVGTCGRCHPGAGRNFSEILMHADYKDRKEQPVLYYTWLFMTGLLVAVFGFFGLHTILWLPRSWIERFRERKRRKGK